MADNSETATDLKVKEVTCSKDEHGATIVVTFDNGPTMQGVHPFSLRPFYTHDVTFQRMRIGYPLISSMAVKRLPLDFKMLMQLATACCVTLEEDIVYELMDDEASGLLQALPQKYPNLVSRLETHQEGIKYLRFEEASKLYKAFGEPLLSSTPARALLELTEIVKNSPALLAFPCVVPQARRPDVKTNEEFRRLMTTLGHIPKAHECAGLKLYWEWLMKDMSYGNTCSPLYKAKKVECAGFNTEGIEYLTQAGIITVRGNAAQLRRVTEMEASIRRSCEILKERFENEELEEIDRSKRAKTNLVELSEEQTEAIETLLNNPVAILSGKAGSGKTTILAHIVDKYGPGTVLACGPTNRAARELTKRVSSARTIHRLVYDLVKGDTDADYSKIHIAIIDEASMLPLDNFAHCLEVMIAKCPKLQRLYLVGDVAQLESVGAGKVLADLAVFFPIAELEECHRVTPEAQLIHSNSVKIREQSTDLKFSECFAMSQCTKTTYNDVEAALKTCNNSTWDTHIVSPYRQDVKEINALAKLLLTGTPHTPGVFNVGDKIVCTRNYHKQGIINGDFFKIVKIQAHGTEWRRMPAEPEKGLPDREEEVPKKPRDVNNTRAHLNMKEWIVLVVVTAAFTKEEAETMDTSDAIEIDTRMIKLSAFQLGYCTTTHKIQGGEADNIIYDLRRATLSDRNTSFVNWKQVYTAVTRAKKRVIVMGTEAGLYRAINTNNIPRNTLLVEHLKDRTPPAKNVRAHQEDPERLEELLNNFEFEKESEEID